LTNKITPANTAKHHLRSQNNQGGKVHPEELLKLRQFWKTFSAAETEDQDSNFHYVCFRNLISGDYVFIFTNTLFNLV
jgi:hypothetical protein